MQTLLENCSKARAVFSAHTALLINDQHQNKINFLLLTQLNIWFCYLKNFGNIIMYLQAQRYKEPCQTSTMKLFPKNSKIFPGVNDFWKRSSIIDLWQGPKYVCMRYFEVPSISAIQNKTTEAVLIFLMEFIRLKKIIEND